MVNLPPEIWYIIICFIPPTSLRTLYAVNRVFFAVVMKEKYRHAMLDGKDEHLIQKLDSLR